MEVFRLSLILALIGTVVYAKSCTEVLSGDSESSILVALKESEYDDSCLKLALDKSWYEAVELLVRHATEKGLAVQDSIKKSLQDTKRKIEKALQTLETGGTKVHIVTPAFQWAQSPDKLFLDIKFAHRLDSPGCLEVKNESVEFKEDHLTFVGFCTQSNTKIKFLLDFETFEKILPEASTYALTSVGRLTITLQKASESAWTRPMKGKKPNNMHTWWEMRERYSKEMNKLTGEEDEVEEKKGSGIEDLVNNPNVVIKDSTINGRRIDNTYERDNGL